MSQKTVIIIGGPTASGKTAVAIQLAKWFGAEIISADSRQCFREMKIGVARPTDAELAAIPHHFIASHSIHDTVTAASFESYALQKAAELFQRHDVVIMVGGTGLYIRAFCEGFDPIPEIPEVVRAEVRSSYVMHGLPWLQAEVEKLDPQYFAAGEIQNPQRLMRALEVFKATGQSVLRFRRREKAQRPFRIVKLALELPKAQLHQNIGLRVDQMIQMGLVEEVRSLIPYQHLNALQTVGYRELFAFFSGESTLANAVEAIKRNTRQYAKRQMTWFRKDPHFYWFAPTEVEAVYLWLQQIIGQTA